MSVNKIDAKIGTLCLSDGFGGLELYAYVTFKKLYEMNNNSIIIIRKHSFLENKLKQANLPYIGIGKVSRYLPLLSAFKLKKLLENNHINVLHIHWAKDVVLAVFTKLIYKNRLKIAYTRQMEIYGDKHDQYHKFIYGKIDLLLMITDKLVQQAIRLLPIQKERIKLLYYGTPNYTPSESTVTDSIRKKFNIGKSDFLVGVVGRIEHAKGQHLLVEAIDSMHRSNVLAHAIIVGNAQDKEYLVKLKNRVAHAGLGPYIHFLEFTDHPKDVMRECDAIVLTTYTETFGLVLIEAMSTGTAVIGTNSGGVPEIISDKETGLLFEPGNSQELANCLIELFRDPILRQNLARNGKKLAHNKFSESRHYEKLFGLLQEMVDNA